MIGGEDFVFEPADGTCFEVFIRAVFECVLDKGQANGF